MVDIKDENTAELIKDFMKKYEENSKKNEAAQAEAIKLLKDLLASSKEDKETQAEILDLLEELLEERDSKSDKDEKEDGESSDKHISNGELEVGGTDCMIADEILENVKYASKD